MSLSEREIAHIVDEVRRLAGESSVQRVLEPDPRQLVLQLRATGETSHLLLGTEKEATRLHFLEEKPDQPGHPSPFAMLARKWVGGAAFESIRRLREDRIVELTFETVDPEWESDGDDDSASTTACRLVAELAGRVGEIFLLDDEGQILGRQTGEAIGGREFDRGDVWTPPPPPPDNPKSERLRWQLDQVPPDGTERSRRVRDAFQKRQRRQRRRDLRHHLETRLEKAVDRLERRVDHVESDLEDVEEADTYRKWADLLQSAYGQIDRGQSSVTVPDYYDDQMDEVEIPLDPEKSLEENIEAYYHEASRLEGARDRVEQRLFESIELRERAEEALAELGADDGPDGLESLRDFEDELVAEGVLRSEATQSSRSDDEESKPYRTFEASSGADIFVGRGPSSNDTLTTQVARGRDVWLHARDWAGAHVLLRIENRGESPRTEDLVDAATLAAHFSQGSNNTVVDVIYTRAKHVRKHAKHGPGRVSVSEDKNIAVELEEARLERLLAKD